MADYVAWFIMAAILVVAELLTGSFYLLMVAIGFFAGGVAALTGAVLPLQCVVVAIVGWLAIVLLRRTRFGQRTRRLATGSNPDVVLDVGQTVDVWSWQEGTARVRYRGSDWDAVPESPEHPATGTLVIKAIRGSTLVLGPTHPTH
ncbi:MAG: NfeD family protein [Burkholderiaceae bacterium]|jgi:membrane protein implicated in regulation of membrane protease activity